VKFTHYLVTRFNVPVESWHHDKSGDLTLDESWFEHRLALFERFCIPSVISQSVNDFHWIIYCDKATHQDQLRKMESAIQDFAKVSIRFAENLTQVVIDFKNLMSQAPSTYVISSRLDNDDGIGRDFIRTIQDHFEEQDKMLINPDGGIQYDADHHVLTRFHAAATNPFISLIEKRSSADDLLTVLGFHHTDIPAGMKVVHIKTGFHWLKIIHHRNVRSTLKGKPIFNLNHKALAAFDKNEFSISFLQTLWYVVKRRWEIWTSK
jgi:hypothetical protein